MGRVSDSKIDAHRIRVRRTGEWCQGLGCTNIEMVIHCDAGKRRLQSWRDGGNLSDSEKVNRREEIKDEKTETAGVP